MFHPVLGEVPELPALGISIVALTFWLVALGVISLVVYIVYGITEILIRTVGRLPGVGGAITSATRYIQSTITTTLGGAIAGIDKNIALFWHALAIEWDWTVRTTEEAAKALLAVASIAVGSPNAQAQGWIHAAIHLALSGLRSVVHSIEHRIANIEHKIEHAGQGAIGAEIQTAIKPIRGELRTLERWTHGQVASLDSTVTGTLEPDVAALRDRVKQLEDGAIRVYRDASGTLRLSSVERFAAAMTLTLPSLGLEWLRCRGMRNFFRGTGCGLGNLMELLLGDAFLALAVTDLCEFANLAMVTARELEPALFALVDATDALVGCHGASKPAALGIPAVPTLITGSGLKLAS